jgi:deazaflavin-dependent oxidoreductase (nitroreductase family)
LPALLLTTTGRKSGKERETPLNYWRDGENVVVVASNGGLNNDPAWLLNLRSNPVATIELEGRRLRVRAEEAVPEDRATLWKRITREAPQYAGYAKLRQTEIPVIVLKPLADEG